MQLAARRTLRRLAFAVLVAASAAAATRVADGAARSVADAPLPRVTVIGDSSMIGVIWYAPALEILRRGLDVVVDVAVCRRLVGESCPFEGQRPLNLVDTVAALGTGVGLAVVVGGYNEPEEEFGQAVDASIAALVRAGAAGILWTTLSEASPMLGRMNAVLRQVPDRHTQVTLLDWNAYSADRNDWFQTDHIHLTEAGAVALATFLRAEIDRALAGEPPSSSPAPPPLAIATPPATVTGRAGRPLRASLRAVGGTPPYRWTLVAGRLPAGLRLSGSSITGTPRSAGRVRVTIRVADAAGISAARRVVFAIAPPPRVQMPVVRACTGLTRRRLPPASAG